MDKVRPESFFKKKAFIALAAAAVLLAIGAVMGYRYYQEYLNVPNFVSAEANYMIVSKEEAKPGEVITYVINLANEGRREATDVLVRSKIPENTQLAEKELDFLKSADGENITFFIGSIGPGQKKKLSFSVVLDSPLDNGTIILNDGMQVSYKRSGTDETIAERFEARLATEVASSIDFSESYYQVTHKGSEYIRMGDTLDVTLCIKNSGDMVANGVNVKGIVPENTDYVQGSFYADSAYIHQEAGERIITLDVIEPQKEAFINFALKIGSGLSDRTEVLFGPGIENSFSQLLLEEQGFEVRAFPEFRDFTLAGVDENGGDLLSHDIIRYDVSFKNTGDGSAYDFFIENAIPAHTTFIDSSIDPSKTSWENGVFKVNVSELGPGEEFSYHYRVQVGGGLNFGAKVTNTSSLVYEGQRVDSAAVTHTVISNYSYNVVVMGDSQVARTQWAGHLNNMFVQRYPYGSFNFIRSGRGGETVVMGYNRMISSGILGQDPYIFIINYGTNDADMSSGYFRTAPDTFAYYLGAMIDTIKTNTGAMVVVMSTGVVDENIDKAHTNSSFSAINNVAAQVCAQRGAVFVDVFNPMMGSGSPGQFLSDGLHYNSAGDQLAARAAFNAISSHLNQYGTR